MWRGEIVKLGLLLVAGCSGCGGAVGVVVSDAGATVTPDTSAPLDTRAPAVDAGMGDDIWIAPDATDDAQPDARQDAGLTCAATMDCPVSPCPGGSICAHTDGGCGCVAWHRMASHCGPVDCATQRCAFYIGDAWVVGQTAPAATPCEYVEVDAEAMPHRVYGEAD
jgi:hypothetical protein